MKLHHLCLCLFVSFVCMAIGLNKMCSKKDSKPSSQQPGTGTYRDPRNGTLEDEAAIASLRVGESYTYWPPVQNGNPVTITALRNGWYKLKTVNGELTLNPSR